MEFQRFIYKDPHNPRCDLSIIPHAFALLTHNKAHARPLCLFNDAKGSPVQGATVEAYGSDVSTWGTQTTDSTGTFTFNVGAGSYTIRAQQGYSIGASDVVNVADGQMQSADVTLNATGGTVAGSILDGCTGHPTQGYVQAVDSNGTEVGFDWAQDGQYSLTLPAGTYTLYVGGNGESSQSYPVTITEGQPIKQDLQLQIGTLSGLVTDLSGSPAANERVHILDQNGGSTIATTDSTGQYKVQLPPGTYVVSASSGYGVSTAHQTTVQVGQQVTLNIQFGTDDGEISGIVKGSTTSGEWVNVLDSSNTIVNSTDLGSDGSYTLAVPVGPYTVVLVNQEKYIQQVPNVNVTADSTVSVPFDAFTQLANEGQFYQTQGDFYNEIYYYGQAIAQGDTDTSLASELERAAQALLTKAQAAMQSGDWATANNYYELLANTAGVPTSLQSDANQSLLSSVGRAEWYGENNNPYNALYYSNAAASSGNNSTGVQGLLSYSAQQLENQTVQAIGQWGVTTAVDDYGLLLQSTGVPADIHSDAQQTLSSDANMGNAWYYLDKNDYYNAAYYLNQELQSGKTSPGLLSLMSDLSQKLQQQAADTISSGDLNPGYSDYQFLSTASGVPDAIKQDAQQSSSGELTGQALHYLNKQKTTQSI